MLWMEKVEHVEYTVCSAWYITTVSVTLSSFSHFFFKYLPQGGRKLQNRRTEEANVAINICGFIPQAVMERERNQTSTLLFLKVWIWIKSQKD